MKAKIGIFAAIGLIVLVVAMSGCTDSGSNTTNTGASSGVANSSVPSTPTTTTTSAATEDDICPLCGAVGEYVSTTADGTGTSYYCEKDDILWIAYPDDKEKVYSYHNDYTDDGKIDAGELHTLPWTPK